MNQMYDIMKMADTYILSYLAAAIIIILMWVIVKHYLSSNRDIPPDPWYIYVIVFCKTMINHIRGIIPESPSLGMDESHRNKILECHDRIVKDMVDPAAVCDALLSANVINETMMEAILAKPTRTEKARELNLTVAMRGHNAYEQYYKALNDSGNVDLAVILCPLVTPSLLEQNASDQSGSRVNVSDVKLTHRGNTKMDFSNPGEVTWNPPLAPDSTRKENSNTDTIVTDNMVVAPTSASVDSLITEDSVVVMSNEKNNTPDTDSKIRRSDNMLTNNSSIAPESVCVEDGVIILTNRYVAPEKVDAEDTKADDSIRTTTSNASLASDGNWISCSRERDGTMVPNSVVYQEKRHARFCVGEQWGSTLSQFSRPYGVAVSPGGRLYVTDTNNQRIMIFAVSKSKLDFIKTFGSRGTGQTSLNHPMGIAINSCDNVIIADSFNHRIVVYDRDGEFMFSFCSNGQSHSPWGVAVDSSDNIYVSDKINHNVQVFRRNGEFIRQFGNKGSAPGEFEFPGYLAVATRTGNIYVADTENHRVQVFSPQGKYISAFGSYGKANGQMAHPTGITIDKQEYIILADTYNDRIQVFDKNGSFLYKFGSSSTRNCQFNHPTGVAVTKDGDVIVADCKNNRILIF